MLLRTLDLNYHDVQIHLQLFDPVTAFFGESGSGKTFIVEAVKEYIRENPDCDYQVLTRDNFGLWKAIDAEQNKIWFIDDVDMLVTLYPEALEYINSGMYYLVVFGRSFYELKIYYRAYQRLSFDPIQKILTTAQPLSGMS